MTPAGWILADDLDARSGRAHGHRDRWPGAATRRRRSARCMLFDRQQDFAYQQEVGGSTSQRHHVRFWRCPEGWMLPGGYAADWLAAGTYDRSVGFSLFTFQITHKIEANTDIERDFVVQYGDRGDPERDGAGDQGLLHRLPLPQRRRRPDPDRRRPADPGPARGAGRGPGRGRPERQPGQASGADGVRRRDCGGAWAGHPRDGARDRADARSGRGGAGRRTERGVRAGGDHRGRGGGRAVRGGRHPAGGGHLRRPELGQADADALLGVRHDQRVHLQRHRRRGDRAGPAADHRHRHPGPAGPVQSPGAGVRRPRPAHPKALGDQVLDEITP